MSWFSRCSWCGGSFNGGNCRRYTNVSFGDKFVCNLDLISNDETPDFSYPPPQPQTSSLDQFHCFHCKDPLEDGVRCQMCTCKWCGYALREGSCWICPLKDGNSSIDAPNSFNDLPDVFTHPPQPQYESYLCELCGNDSHYGYDCPPRFPLESTIPLNEIVSQIPPSIAITPVLPTLEPKDSLIMGNEELSTIPEKESDEFIKSSVEDLVPIPSESKDTSESDSDCDLPSCDNFSSINIYEEKSATFSNLLFDSNDDFTSSDDESLFDEDVPKDINIESKDSYVSNIDEPALLVTPLFDFNKDECFDQGSDVDEIEFLLHRDPSKISVAYILKGFTDEPPLEENDDLFDLESKENEWKKILYDASIDDLMTEDKVFDPGIHDKKNSLTYVRLPFEDCHYLSLTYVIQIFLPYFTYPVESSLPLSSRSEDIIFDPGIFAYSFYSLEPVAYECPMEVCSSTCFILNITMIQGELTTDVAAFKKVDDHRGRNETPGPWSARIRMWQLFKGPSGDLGKLNAKADICIFVGYAPTKKAFRIYNKRTQKIMETIHVTLDELTALASE
ncbi:hypothetical protein Tco_1403769 [Tanacetum coccineum]